MRTIIAASMIAAAVSGCGDDEHKGTVSHGSASATSSPPAMTRLVVGPGSPLSSAPVAARIRERLLPLGIDARHIKIGGDEIHVDVPSSKLVACKRALEGGRFDLHLFDDRADPFASSPQAHKSRFEVGSESVRDAEGKPAVRRFLMGTPAERDDLFAYLKEHAAGAMPALGPMSWGATQPQRLRSYYLQAGSARVSRGEQLAGARAERDGDEVRLALELVGSGASFVRWASKQRARFVVLVEGLVVGTSQPTSEIADGKLSVVIERRGNADATLADVHAMAKSIDAKALSHAVELRGERAL